MQAPTKGEREGTWTTLRPAVVDAPAAAKGTSKNSGLRGCSRSESADCRRSGARGPMAPPSAWPLAAVGSGRVARCCWSGLVWFAWLLCVLSCRRVGDERTLRRAQAWAPWRSQPQIARALSLVARASARRCQAGRWRQTQTADSRRQTGDDKRQTADWETTASCTSQAGGTHGRYIYSYHAMETMEIRAPRLSTVTEDG